MAGIDTGCHSRPHRRPHRPRHGTDLCHAARQADSHPDSTLEGQGEHLDPRTLLHIRCRKRRRICHHRRRRPRTQHTGLYRQRQLRRGNPARRPARHARRLPPPDRGARLAARGWADVAERQRHEGAGGSSLAPLRGAPAAHGVEPERPVQPAVPRLQQQRRVVKRRPVGHRMCGYGAGTDDGVLSLPVGDDGRHPLLLVHQRRQEHQDGCRSQGHQDRLEQHQKYILGSQHGGRKDSRGTAHGHRGHGMPDGVWRSLGVKHADGRTAAARQDGL